jgi:hypothetical protein
LNRHWCLLRFEKVQPFAHKLKTALKDLIGLGCFSMLRWAERRLSTRSLFSILKTIFYARATLNTVFKNPKSSVALPVFLQSANTITIRIQKRAVFYLNRMVEFFPDRLTEAKWMNHCRMDGLGYLQAAQQNERPVVLAFCHFGPYCLLRSWLRAAGFPAGVLLAGEAARRTRLRRFQDRFSIRPEIPLVLYQDHWREVAEFLKAGNPLLIAIDVPSGKQLDVPFSEGWTFQMAAGAVRLALRHQAELIPCCIIDEGAWHFRIKLGPPVPRDYLTSGADGFHAGKYLIEEMLHDFHSCPGQCTADLTRCLKPNLPAVALNQNKTKTG